MSITKSLLTVLFLVILFSGAGFTGNDDTAAKQRLAKSLQNMDGDILTGANLKDASTHIDVEAYLIDGKYYESLLGVLNGESAHCKLIEGKDTKFAFQSLTIMDNLSAALMVLKTETPTLGERFHSVVFFHDSGADWKIKSWHISQ